MFGFTLYELIWFFFIYAFLGWCVEVVFCSVNTGHWVNRGFLNGPVCPIYGFGMVIVLLCLTPLSGNLLVLFIGSFFLTSALELVTGFVLKQAFHTTWWDYTDQPFNIGGYVCLKFSLAWGLGGMAAVRLLHPPIARLVNWMPRAVGWSLAAVFGAAFLADFIVTLTSLAGLRKDLRELDKIAAALHKCSDTISCNLGSGAVNADAKLEAGREKLPERIASLEAHRDLLRARILDRRLTSAAHLMKAFPNMQILRHRESFAQVRKELHQRRKKQQ